MAAFKVSDDWLLSPHANSVTFEDDSVNNGTGIVQADNYYAVPKDVLDALLKQEQTLQLLLQKVLEKL